MIRVGIVGLGKMGLSHLSMFNAHPDLEVAGICDSTGYLLSMLGKYTGLTTYSDIELHDRRGGPRRRRHRHAVADARVDGADGAGAGPARLLREAVLPRPGRVASELTALAESKGLVTQVGYHYRFVGAFQEVKRLLDAGAIGRVTHVLAEAYGPVVLKPQGATWRSQEEPRAAAASTTTPPTRSTWSTGTSASRSAPAGTVLNQVFSRETDDEVYGTLFFADGVTASVSVNWSDESQRKMTTKITIWGTQGRIYADRQEVQVFLRDERRCAGRLRGRAGT